MLPIKKVLQQFGKKLIQDLESTKEGQKDWRKYEFVTREILEFLFVDYLFDNELGVDSVDNSIPKIDKNDFCFVQDATDNRREIRDIIMPNFATKGFWRYIRERYDGDQIVVDCKNYSEPLTKEQVLPVAHYITKKSCGLFALICSRSEITESAHNAIKHQWIHYDKMIICLSDEVPRV